MTHLSSASRASLDSGIALMLMMSPPQRRYMLLSARVENCGPSMTTRVFWSCSRGRSSGFTWSSKLEMASLTSGAMNCAVDVSVSACSVGGGCERRSRKGAAVEEGSGVRSD